MIDAKRFDALTFDVLGTIVNWEPEIADALQLWAQSNGLSVSRNDLLETYDRVRQPLQTRRPALRYPEAAFDLPVSPSGYSRPWPTKAG